MPNTVFSIAERGNRPPFASPDTLARIEAFDWGATPLGPIVTWPEALVSATRLMLASRSAMALMAGPQGILIYNDSYAAIAQDRHPDVLGMPATEAWPEIAEFNAGVRERVLAGETLEYLDQELMMRRGGRVEPAWFDLEYSPVLDRELNALAVFCVVTEVTKLRSIERALARTKERLSLALSASGIVGTWDWDVVGDVIVADEQFSRLFGLDPATASRGTPIAAYLKAIHPDDIAHTRAAIERAMESGEQFSHEYRIVQADGSARWVLAQGKCVNDDKGRCVRFPGIVIDITDQKAIADALRITEAEFRTLADSMPQMVWATRPDGHHDYYNAQWYEFTGMQPGTTDGEGWNDVFHPDDQQRAWARWRHSLETGEPYEIEYRLRHRSGEYRWTLGRALPLRDADGTIVRWFGTCTDIHEAKLTAEEREVIAQELSHRIKNIFSVLSGIIGLSARSYPEGAPLARQLRERIAAMGKAHDLVRPHSADSAPRGGQPSFHALVRLLTAPFEDRPGERVVLEGPDVAISDGAATPLSLLIHELASNAAKYGALSRSDGRVRVSSQSNGEGYRFRWTETGGPQQPAARSEGFGTRLITLSVERQLSGRIERTWGADGLDVEIELPMSALTRSSRLGRPLGD